MDPRPIQRTNPIIHGRNPENPRLNLIRIELDYAPHPEWVKAFKNPPGLGRRVPLHRPEIDGANIIFSSPEGEEAMWSRDIVERIDAANEWFLKEYVPNWKKRREEENRIQQAEQQALRAAQERLDKEFGA